VLAGADSLLAGESHLGAAIAAYREALFLGLVYAAALDVQRDYYAALEPVLAPAEIGRIRYGAARVAYLAGDYLQAEERFAQAVELLADRPAEARLAQLGLEACRVHRGVGPVPMGAWEALVAGGEDPRICLAAAEYALDFSPAAPRIREALAVRREHWDALSREGAVADLLRAAADGGERAVLHDALLGLPYGMTTLGGPGQISRQIGLFDPGPLRLARRMLLAQAREHARLALERRAPASRMGREEICLHLCRILHEIGALDETTRCVADTSEMRLWPCRVLAAYGAGRIGAARDLWQVCALRGPMAVQMEMVSLSAEAGVFPEEAAALSDRMIAAAAADQPRLPAELCETAGRVAAARRDYVAAESWFRKARAEETRAAGPSPLLILRHALARYRRDRDGVGFVLEDLRALERRYAYLRQVAEPLEIVYASLIRDIGRDPISR